MQAHACACMFNMHKTSKLVSHTAVRNFGMHMRASEYTQHTRDACHKLALGFPNYTCGVTMNFLMVGSLESKCVALVGLYG